MFYIRFLGQHPFIFTLVEQSRSPRTIALKLDYYYYYFFLNQSREYWDMPYFIRCRKLNYKSLWVFLSSKNMSKEHQVHKGAHFG